MLPPDNFQEDPRAVLAHRTSPTNIGLYLLSTVSGARLRLDRDCSTRVERHRSDARHDGAPAALPRPLLQLVRHARPAPARAALRLVGGQRQPRRAPRSRWPARAASGSDTPAPTGRRRRRARRRAATWRARRCASFRRSRPAITITRGLLEDRVRRSRGGACGRADWRAIRTPTRCAAAVERAATLVDMVRTLAQRDSTPIAATDLRRTGCEATRRTIESWRTRPAARATRRGVASSSTSRSLATARSSWPTRWSSASCSTRSASCCRSATAPPTARSTPAATTCSPPKRGSRASSRSPRATCRRGTGSGSAAPSRRSAHGAALISWSGSMFEYLMPSLVMRAPAGSLLEQTSRLIVQRQIAYGAELGPALGRLGVRLQRARSRAHLSVFELRRARPRVSSAA